MYQIGTRIFRFGTLRVLFPKKNGLFEAISKSPFRFRDLCESRRLADSESRLVRRPFRNEHHLDTAILLFRSLLLGSFAGAGGETRRLAAGPVSLVLPGWKTLCNEADG